MSREEFREMFNHTLYDKMRQKVWRQAVRRVGTRLWVRLGCWLCVGQ
jgi:hypothetical protein